jgi:phage-related protein
MATFSFTYARAVGYRLKIQFKTGIFGFDAGAEQRQSEWDTPRRAWTLTFLKDETDYDAFVAFFEARKGAGESFDWTDPRGVARRVRFLGDILEMDVEGGIASFETTLIECLGEDITPPTVQSVSPANGGSSGGLDAAVTWTMSEAIDPADMNETYFSVLDGTTGAVVAGSLSMDGGGTQITFAPAAAWTEGRLYIARVAKGVRDLSGNRLAASYGSRFTAAV